MDNRVSEMGAVLRKGTANVANVVLRRGRQIHRYMLTVEKQSHKFQLVAEF